METTDLMVSVLLATIAFSSVLGLALAARMWFNPVRTARDRISELTGTATTIDPLFTTDQSAPAFAVQIGKLASPSSETERNLLRQRLDQAGIRHRNNLEVFTAVRATTAILPPLIAAIFLPPLQIHLVLLLVLTTATVGYFLPSLLLNWALHARQSRILRPFPDTLDLLVSCVEAGLGLDAALRRVAGEMERAAPELALELSLVNHEVAAGVPRADALRHLVLRTGLEEVKSLVNVLLQADRFGTSVAKALRIHAELVRAKRMLQFEEQAARISPKLTVVMILFILPSLMLVLIGPALINVARNLLPTLQGGGGP